jgi:hypothetical protein
MSVDTLASSRSGGGVRRERRPAARRDTRAASRARMSAILASARAKRPSFRESKATHASQNRWTSDFAAP